LVFIDKIDEDQNSELEKKDRMQYRLTPIAAALAVAFIVPMSMAQAQTTDTPSSQVNATGNEALPDITVNADASKDGLPKERAGGQVAKGSRLGILGNVDNIDSPVSSTAYTSQLIEDQQAHSIGDVLKNDPIVTTTRGYGNYQESYMIRGFIANSDDLMFNGLYGVLPRQYLASEMVERVEVLYGASAFLNGAAPGNAGLGGTINIVPKRASSDPLTEVTLGYESGNAKYVNVDLGRRFGPEDRVGIRINAARHAGGTGISGEKTETNVFTLGADYRGNDFRLSADFGIQENNQTGIRPSVMLDSGLTAVPSAASASSNFAQPWSYSCRIPPRRGQHLAHVRVLRAARSPRLALRMPRLGQPLCTYLILHDNRTSLQGRSVFVQSLIRGQYRTRRL